MRAFGPSILALAALLSAITCRADEESFGSPAMLPLPASLATPGAAPYSYTQPQYPPGLVSASAAYTAPQNDPSPAYQAPAYQAPAHQGPVYQGQMYQGGYAAPRYPYSHRQPAPSFGWNQQPAGLPGAVRQMPGYPRVASARYQPMAEPVMPPTIRSTPGLANQPQMTQQGGCQGGNCFEEAIGSPCGSCNTCNACCRPMWFGAIGGMVLTRNNPNPTWTSALVSNNNDQVMNTVDAHGGWRAGGEVRFGRQFCCGGAWDVTWWTIAPLTGFASVRDPGNLLTPIDLFGVSLGGTPVSNFFDNAQEHRVWREDTFQNVEFNLYSVPLALPYCPCTIAWLGGLRYFQFNEGVIFGSVAGGNEFGSDGGIHEAYLNSQVRNRLLGVQTGAIANYFVRPRLSIFAVPKFGIFNNWAHEDFQLYRGDGLNGFTVRGNANLVSFLGQFDTGLNWAITPRCSIYGGYRVLVVSGVALADTQFPHYLIDQPEIGHIKPNNDLILHGAIFGVQFFF